MTISGNVSSTFSTSLIWETGSFSISLLKTATLTSTESLSGNTSSASGIIISHEILRTE